MALALFVLFAVFSTAAQAMLLTLDLRWDASHLTPGSDGEIPSNLQVGSIIQVIGYKSSESDYDPDDSAYLQPDMQFVKYGETDSPSSAAPYSSGHEPTDSPVYLANTTYTNHTILYTGTIQSNASWYGIYTQITVDDWLYDKVYIRVFGATNIAQGVVTASYWGVSAAHTLNPVYQTDTLGVTNFVAENKNYFEVIPEPATMGLLGAGGIALAIWRRRRFLRTGANGTVREED